MTDEPPKRSDQERAMTGSQFGVTQKQMTKLVDAYRQRKYVEDLDSVRDDYKGTEGILKSLDSSVSDGIKTTSLDEREKVFGHHRKEKPQPTGFCAMVKAALDDLMLQVLIACAIFSIVVEVGFVAGGCDRSPTATKEAQAECEKLKTAWIEGFAILTAVAVVSLFSAWSDHNKEKQFLEQQQLDTDSKIVWVKRDGQVKDIHKDNIMCGDIIQIKDGMDIPVDGILVHGSCMADESAMTGESDHLPKETVEKCFTRKDEFENDAEYDPKKEKTAHDVPSCVMLSGTSVATGEGWFLCIVVGDETCEGQIMAQLEEVDLEQTPLQKKLDVIAMDIGRLGMYAAILIFHCLLIRNFIEGMIYRKYDLYGGELTGQGKWCNLENPPLDPTDEKCSGQLVLYVKEYLHFIIVGVAIVVVAVPEGLPLAVMISLAFSVKKMLKDQNFVKKLASCEIMGGANNICSDKTGTLTKNQMTLTDMWQGAEYKISNPDGTDQFDTSHFCRSDVALEKLRQAIACNSKGLPGEDGVQATDLAMLKFIARCKCDIKSYRERFPNLLRFQFDSARKRMSTLIQNGESKTLQIKGASEIILGTCTHYLDADGQRQELNDGKKEELKQQITHFAEQALRTIGLAYKDIKDGDGGATHEDKRDGSKIYEIEEGGHTLISIIGIKDIIREEVPKAVVDCNDAGVRVRMVTGDNKVTAIAIAMECGIIQPEEKNDKEVCMEGPEFAEFVGGLVHKTSRNDPEKNQVWEKGDEIKVLGKFGKDEVVGKPDKMKIVRDKLKVLARSRPNDKYIMVAGLKELGDIVAVTGDGTNDAPALKKADVGFAMRTGTQVAHNASDIIIQDDNFASIIKACMWGRNVYDNIRKFLQFQLTVNVVALITAFIGAVVMWESPLAAIQLLWVNLIMDSLAALALATEDPKPILLKRQPYRKNEYIISQRMIKHILGQSLFQAFVLFFFVFGAHTFVRESVEGIKNTDCNVGLCKTQIESHPIESWRTYDGPYVMNGMVQGFDGNDLYRPMVAYTPSRHLTVVFNVFVLFQVFNMLAARKINDEKNIFAGVFDNAYFVVVWIFIAAGQYFITQFGSLAMKVHISGLTGEQWVISVVVGFTSLIINFLLKFVPDSMCFTMGDEVQEDVDAAKADYDKLKAMSKSQKSIWKMTDDLPPAGVWVPPTKENPNGKYIPPVQHK